MSELESIRACVTTELGRLQGQFDETARDALVLITDPEFALKGMVTDAPAIEADIPIRNVTVGDTLYSDALLHLSVTREIHEKEIFLIGLAKKVLGPVRSIPFIRPAAGHLPVAISATVRQKIFDGSHEKIVPITGPIEVNMRNFDHDLHAQQLPDIRNIQICTENLRVINELIAKT
jgi:hypothetical protein